MDPTKERYDVSDNQVGFLGTLSNIGFLPFAPATVYLTRHYGLRLVTILGLFVVALGCLVRLIPDLCDTSHETAWYGCFFNDLHVLNLLRSLLVLGQSLNAVAGPVTSATAPYFSAKWFAPEERAASTACLYLSQGVGVALAFAVGPAMVSSSKELQNLLIMEFAWASTALLASFLYFPADPPTPPSLSATIERLDFVAGFKLLLSNPRFLFLVLALTIPGGFMVGWGLLLDEVLGDLFSETTIGNLNRVCVMVSWLGTQVGLASLPTYRAPSWQCPQAG